MFKELDIYIYIYIRAYLAALSRVAFGKYRVKYIEIDKFPVIAGEIDNTEKKE